MPTLDENRQAVAVAFNNQRALDVLAAFRRVLAVPGPNRYDVELVARIASLQAEKGLVVDGKVGQRTREVLNTLQAGVSASALWPDSGATTDAKLEHYGGLCERLGHQISLERPLLIAFRGLSLRSAQTHPSVSRPLYDDSFVFITRKGDVSDVREFSGATHPYQLVTTAAPDVDGDGTPDVGTIRPGAYVLERLPSDADHPKLWLKQPNGDAQIPTWRDTNHDGVIGEIEQKGSEDRDKGAQVRADIGDYSTEVLLHPGFTARTTKGKAYSSIGCQTAALEDVKAVAAHAKVDYLLLDARSVVLALTGAAADA